MSEDRDVERCEWDGNKYDLPRTSPAHRKLRAWITSVALAAIFVAYVLAILMITGRFG